MFIPTSRTGARVGPRRGHPCARRRLIVLVAAVPAAFCLSVTSAAAVPTEGDAVPSVLRWGCGDGPTEPAFPGQRHGCLAPGERGPVLEFMDR